MAPVSVFTNAHSDPQQLVAADGFVVEQDAPDVPSPQHSALDGAAPVPLRA